MNRETYLLFCLAEEAAEVAKAASKAARFGLDPSDQRPARWRDVSNREDLECELGDVLAVAGMLGLKPVVDECKRSQVERFMRVSRNVGTLQKDEDES